MNGFNFTHRVRRMLAVAREEAVALRHPYVGTEHILIATARETDGVAHAVIASFGARGDEIVQRVLETVQPGLSDASRGPDLPYTTRGKKVLELSMSEARMLDQSWVGTEHVLLGLLAEQKGVGAQVLQSFGLTIDATRARTVEIQKTVRDGAGDPPAPPAAVTPGWARSRSPYGVALVEDFTGRAREVLRSAYEEAATRDHRAVELSHVLLALASREDGMAGVLLDQVVGSRARVADALVQRLPDKEDGVDRRSLQLDPQTQVALDNALLEASKDGHRRAGTQHLLLAVLDALPITLAAACAQLGLSPKATRTVYERMRE